MKKSTVVVFVIASLVAFSSFALAPTPAKNAPIPVDVTTAAAAVPNVPNRVIDLSDEDILSVASPVDLSAHGLNEHAMSATAGEIESPETEGPESDGPGGPDHEFDGEETGQH